MSLLTEEEIFAAAMEKRPAERASFLDRACAGDASLRAEVELLLKAYEAPDSLLSPTGIQATIVPVAHDAERPGKVIGPYKLLEQIGEGGMGVVYVAEQTEPVRRRVALKIIKPGMDTRQVIARFEAERQALAMMDHPHIAKVLDAGTTDAGRPYFVMELVRGLPVTEYCDKARLSPRQRLELFIDVCHAVQHAHQKGVIHRDLKPSNVMITVHDGRPVAKVIDFGVAKAVGQQLTERTVYTAHTQLVGTPLYMSPEQADFSSQDVDTRTDVYSLGVLLYELLTGQTPFDKETLHKAGFDEMRRIIREDEPPCPSRRFSTLSAQAISTVSQHRSVDERHLGRVLRGELDWIVMKALEKDRSRRYESASALAADIQRYLSDEPVLACPPTAMYRFQKFTRKHKPALFTAASIVLCLLLGTTVSAWQAVRATTAEAQATANEQKAVINEQKANANAAQAQEKAQEATTQRDEAQKQRDEVQALNNQLAAKEQQLQRNLYAAHMNLAHSAWESDAGGAKRVRQLLEQHRPKPGETDMRGFEWYYLHRQCNSHLLRLNGHTGWVLSVAYSPDGKRLASASVDKTVKVWDAQSGEELLTLKGHTGYVRGVAYSPDGRRIASYSYGDKVRVWDAQTGQELLTINVQNAGGFNDVTFSPDGKLLTSISEDGTEVKLWDAQSGQEVLALEGGASSVAFSPDSKRLTGGYKGKVRVWDVQTGKELLAFNGDSSQVTFSPDGKRLATGSNVWDAQTGEKLLNLKGHTAGVSSVVFRPDGRRLATGSYDKTVRVWHARTGKELLNFRGHDSGVRSVAFSPDGKRLAASDNSGVTVWDAQTDQKPLTLWGHTGVNRAVSTGGVKSVAFSPDGKLLASGGERSPSSPGELKLWDTRTGQELFTLKGHSKTVWSVAFSPDGKRLASGSADPGPAEPGELKMWDALTGSELFTLAGNSRCVAFSPDGKRFASASGMGKITVADAQTGEELIAIKSNGWCVAFSPDGKRLAMSSAPWPNADKVTVLDAQTGQELFSRAGPGTGILSIVFSPDGKHLAPCFRENVVRVWDAQTGEELLTAEGHVSTVTRVAFSPDRKRLASTSSDGTVKVWDAQTGQELLSFQGNAGLYNGIAFSTDGYRLAAGSDHGTIKIYDATPLPEKP